MWGVGVWRVDVMSDGVSGIDRYVGLGVYESLVRGGGGVGLRVV